ncbi:MAG: hypothetical protein QXZ59_06705 [Nitrososphaeria archaeon]
MTVLKNFLANGNVEIIFLTNDDVPICIYELDASELAELEEILGDVA